MPLYLTPWCYYRYYVYVLYMRNRAAYDLTPPYNNSQRARTIDNLSRSRCQITKIVPARSHWIFIICWCAVCCPFCSFRSFRFVVHRNCGKYVPPFAVMSYNCSDVTTCPVAVRTQSVNRIIRSGFASKNFCAESPDSFTFRPEVISDS